MVIRAVGLHVWKRYESIQDVGKDKALHVARAVDPSMEWVATEKVHGANFCFETDGARVDYASRTQRLGGDADFYRARTTMPRYHPFALEAFRLTRERWPELRQLLIYGEYFGGFHPGIPKEEGIGRVQKGVIYSPGHEFFAFDVCVNGDFFLDFDDAREILVSASFPLVAAPLLRGSLAECLALDVEALESTVPALLGLPPLGERNIAEGIVVRLARESRAPPCGERLLLKKKALAFWEATSQYSVLAKRMEEAATGGTGQAGEAPEEVGLHRRWGETAQALITENRLQAVISKSPDLLQPRNHARLVGLFAQDVIGELGELNAEELADLSKEDLKVLKKSVHFRAERFAAEELPKLREELG